MHHPKFTKRKRYFIPTGTRTLPENLDDFKKKIAELNSLGWSSVDIGRVTSRDHSTILYHLRNLGVKPTKTTRKTTQELQQFISILKADATILPDVENNCMEEKINISNKSYADYLKEDEERKYKKLLSPKTNTFDNK